jgi:hypothetical protein
VIFITLNKISAGAIADVQYLAAYLAERLLFKPVFGVHLRNGAK